ncbi:DeoR/GlpR family DNA-binding transcription regulator [uncultured Tessaracoccus sp.]|uniref:DeoR/GlpR family DNA-binding transcription regulator n=1 Tax=uncultured Tessaracoccus sp. TaxID=905023 RepID=UPI00261D40C8|nr:DeoR/GlpR family DNA-binding transcription regulator [uncultured Tessaracoccus sp.]
MHGGSSKKRSDRLVALLDMVHDRGAMSLVELAEHLGASPATIRRDVVELASQGLVERTHGSVRAAASADGELPFHLRDTRQVTVKRAIGRRAALEIPFGRHAVAFTGGSTTATVLRELSERRDLTVITNSISIGLQAAELNMEKVLIAGGVLRPNSLELGGPLTESTMNLMHIDTAIVGADGCTVEHGLTTHDDVEARTNRAMVQRAARVVATLDSSKIGHVTKATILGMRNVDVLITDDGASQKVLRRIRELGVKVIVVDTH